MANSPSSDPDNYPGHVKLRQRAKYYAPFLLLVFFADQLDQSIAVTSYEVISRDLHRLDLSGWIPNAWLCGYISVMPLTIKLSDIYGRKPILLTCQLIVIIGLVLSAKASTMPMLIIGRALQGLGASAGLPMYAAIINDALPQSRRGKPLACLTAIYGLGTALGPVLGGIITGSIGWRWIFWMQVPVASIALLGTLAFLPWITTLEMHNLIDGADPSSDATGDMTWWAAATYKLKQINFVGTALFSAMTILLTVALDQAAQISWSSPMCWAFLIGTAVLLAAVVLDNHYTINDLTRSVRQPLFPKAAFATREARGAYWANAFGIVPHFSALFWIPLYFQVVDNVSATIAGLLTLPWAAAVLLIAVYTAWYGTHDPTRSIGKTFPRNLLGHIRFTHTANNLAGAPIALAGLILVCVMAFCAAHSYVLPAFGLFLTSVGGNISMFSWSMLMQEHIDQKSAASGLMILYLIRGVFSNIGIAGIDAILETHLRNTLPGILGAQSDLADQLRNTIEPIKLLDPTKAYSVRMAYGHGLGWGFVAVTSCLPIAWLAAFYARKRKPDSSRDQESKESVSPQTTRVSTALDGRTSIDMMIKVE